jgi:hypothetical protein
MLRRLDPDEAGLVVCYQEAFRIGPDSKWVQTDKRPSLVSIPDMFERDLVECGQYYDENERIGRAKIIFAFRMIEGEMESINASNLQHSWQAFRKCDGGRGLKISFQPSVCLRQIHSRRGLFKYTRQYTWGPMGGQGLSKQQRRGMLIDGEPTAELDFVAYDARLLYHLAKIDPKADDLYFPDRVCPTFWSFQNATAEKRKLVRDFIKKCTNICWNTSSRSKAIGAVRMQLKKSDERLRDIIYKTEDTGAKGILARIQAVHPELADKFFTEAGADLMTMDGMIMRYVLWRHAQAGKPALGVHDSVVVRASDAPFAEEIMNDVYRRAMGFLPKIRRVY